MTEGLRGYKMVGAGEEEEEKSGLVSDLAEGVDLSVFSKPSLWFGWFSLSARCGNRQIILKMWQGTKIWHC